MKTFSLQVGSYKLTDQHDGRTVAVTYGMDVAVHDDSGFVTVTMADLPMRRVPIADFKDQVGDKQFGNMLANYCFCVLYDWDRWMGKLHPVEASRSLLLL